MGALQWLKLGSCFTLWKPGLSLMSPETPSCSDMTETKVEHIPQGNCTPEITPAEMETPFL